MNPLFYLACLVKSNDELTLIVNCERSGIRPHMSNQPIHSPKIWSETRPLSHSLQRAEAAVRAQPRNPRSRWLLFELVCLLGRWERALLQLDIWAGLQHGSEDVVRIFRNLIRGEIQREKILNGLAAPSICGAPNGLTAIWMLQLAQAMRAVAHAGNNPLAAIAAGDAMRRAALAEAPASSGVANGLLTFRHISDSDSRVGPVCEATLVEGYRWIAFGNIRRLYRSPTSGLLDLIWSPVQLELRHGEVLVGHLPMRYPLRKDDRDALLMCRDTVWTTLGETAILGHGRKVWRTDQGNLTLHDLHECVFN